MAAGLGFKDFTTGEVLTAADVDGYLMQGIWVFASEAARNAAVTSPQEGNFAFTKDNNSLWYYDGAAWVASGATGDIEGVTAGVGISGGGTSGTVTITNSMATAIDAKGDLVGGTGADTFARLAVGANGTVLTADSAETTGLKWATPSSTPTFVGARAGRVNSNQTINNNTNTVVLWDSEAFQPNFDTDSIHSTTTNTGRFTVPTGKGGYWLCIATVQFESNGTGIRAGDFLINTDLRTKGFRLTPSSATDTVYSASTVLKLAAADFVEFQVYQNSGTSLAIQGDSYNNQFVFTFLGA